MMKKSLLGMFIICSLLNISITKASVGYSSSKSLVEYTPPPTRQTMADIYTPKPVASRQLGRTNKLPPAQSFIKNQNHLPEGTVFEYVRMVNGSYQVYTPNHIPKAAGDTSTEGQDFQYTIRMKYPDGSWEVANSVLKVRSYNGIGKGVINEIYDTDEVLESFVFTKNTSNNNSTSGTSTYKVKYNGVEKVINSQYINEDTGYIKIPISYITGGAPHFSNGDRVSIVLNTVITGVYNTTSEIADEVQITVDPRPENQKQNPKSSKIRVLVNTVLTSEHAEQEIIKTSFDASKARSYTWVTKPSTAQVANDLDGVVRVTYNDDSYTDVPVKVDVYRNVCFKPATTTGTALPTKLGVTTIKNQGGDPWPTNRNGAWMALESNNKGLVLTRMTTGQINAMPNPQEGMITFDTTAKCIKIYDGTKWGCLVESCDN